MIPETINPITQYPMMSRAPNPAMPSAGKAQKGKREAIKQHDLLSQALDVGATIVQSDFVALDEQAAGYVYPGDLRHNGGALLFG